MERGSNISGILAPKKNVGSTVVYGPEKEWKVSLFQQLIIQSWDGLKLAVL